MTEASSRTEHLLGSAALERLAAARVAVFGLGGVGGAAVEALARAGVGTLDLIDCDRIAESNLNRQILATEDTIGMLKTEAAEARVRAVSKSCIVHRHEVFFLPGEASLPDFSDFDYIIDAIDTVTGKIEIAVRAAAAGTPLISCMGTGNRLDPTAFRVGDLFDTTEDPLARVMRKELRRRGIDRLRVVYSLEPPLRPVGDLVPEEGSSRRSIPGSVSFVPPVAGMIAAGKAVRYLAGLQTTGERY